MGGVNGNSNYEGVILTDPKHGFDGGLYIGLTGGPQGLGPPSTDWALAGGSVALSNVPAVYGVNNFFVLHASFLPGDDRYDLYVNSVPGQLPATPNATKADIDLQPSILYLEDGNGSITIDELRIGTTFADVSPVPEPGSIGLIIAGGLTLIATRRFLKRQTQFQPQTEFRT